MTALENKSQPITQETASTKNDNTPTATPQQRFQINSVEVKNFKRISEAKVPLNVITYLVGGNNSGKSSVLQAIHTAVSCMQISVE